MYLISRMLAKNIKDRLWKLNFIKSDVWFEGFGWDDLIALKLPTPFLPIVNETIHEEYPFMKYLHNINEGFSFPKQSFKKKSQEEVNRWMEEF